MRRLLAGLLLSGLAWAPGARAQVVEIIEYGTYVTSGDSPSPDNRPDAVVELRSVHDPRFVDRTTTIPGQLCQRFGIRFVLRDAGRLKRPGSGAPPGVVPGLVPVEIHITHPRLVNPDGRSSDGERWPQVLVAGEPSMAGFDFDQGWEIAPGTWTMAVEIDGKVMASQSFVVTDVPGGGGAGDGCQHLS